MSYLRVIPRDFFNEAKLLKCLGALQLHILDHVTSVQVEYDGEAFNVVQNPNDGSISVANYYLYLKGHSIYLYCPLNSRDNWPLQMIYRDEEYTVFDSTGKLYPTIRELLK